MLSLLKTLSGDNSIKDLKITESYLLTTTFGVKKV